MKSRSSNKIQHCLLFCIKQKSFCWFLSNKTIQSRFATCLFCQSSTHICRGCMIFCSQLCLWSRFQNSQQWLCLTVWCLQMEIVCSMWLTSFLSHFYCLRCIDFNIDFVLLQNSVLNCFRICLFFNMFVVMFRLDIQEQFISFLQVNSCSRSLQSCQWFAFFQYHSANAKYDFVIAENSSIFILRQRRNCVRIIRRLIWLCRNNFDIVDWNSASLWLMCRFLILWYTNIVFETKSEHLESLRSVFLFVLHSWTESCSTMNWLTNKQMLCILLTFRWFFQSVKYIRNKFELIQDDFHHTTELWQILINYILSRWLCMLYRFSTVKLINLYLTKMWFRSKYRSGWLCLCMFNQCCMFWLDMFSFIGILWRKIKFTYMSRHCWLNKDFRRMSKAWKVSHTRFQHHSLWLTFFLNRTKWCLTETTLFRFRFYINSKWNSFNLMFNCQCWWIVSGSFRHVNHILFIKNMFKFVK